MAGELSCIVSMFNFINVLNNLIVTINDQFSREVRLLKRKRRSCLMQIKNMRRRQLMLFGMLNSKQSPKILWERERTQCFWEIDCQRCSEEVFKENFRMSRDIFQALCDLLKSLKKDDTRLRKAIPLEKRVAVALYALGSSSEYRTVANLFGIGKSTVCVLMMEFCSEAWYILHARTLNHFPLTSDKIKECVEGFEVLGFPQCLGAIDGTHIEVHPHKEDAVDYYNYKGWYSTVLLALVDFRYRFLYINVGSPGRCNDSQIYQNSALKRAIDECELLTSMSRTMSGVDVPVVILGDSAFRLSTSLMKPYPFNGEANFEEKLFNYNLSKCRRVVENAFGHLKARFRRLAKGIDNNIEHCPLIIKTCCALHNFLNDNNDIVNVSWLQESRSREKNREQPETVIAYGANAAGADIRKAISNFMSGLAPSSVADSIDEGLFSSTSVSRTVPDEDGGESEM